MTLRSSPPLERIRNKFSYALENAFFLSHDLSLRKLQERLHRMKISKETLSMLSGIQDELLLQTLVDLRIGPENIVALALIPLIAIAWADGKIDMKEQNALLLATVYCGMKKGTIDYRLFADWIQLKPAPILLRAWAQYVRHLCESLPPDDNKKMKSEIIGRARSVAEASGGILGYRIGDRISRNEQAVLARLRRAFIR